MYVYISLFVVSSADLVFYNRKNTVAYIFNRGNGIGFIGATLVFDVITVIWTDLGEFVN